MGLPFFNSPPPPPPPQTLFESYETALIVGGCCAAVQLFCYLFFSTLAPDGPWRREPGFSAHQVVALPFMVYLTCVGAREWFFPTVPIGGDALARTVELHAVGHHLAQCVFGAVSRSASDPIKHAPS